MTRGDGAMMEGGWMMMPPCDVVLLIVCAALAFVIGLIVRDMK